MRLASKLVKGEKMREIIRGLLIAMLSIVVLAGGLSVSSRIASPFSGIVVVITFVVTVYLMLVAVRAKVDPRG